MDRRPNPAEQSFRQLAEAEGWDVTKRGWPDFLCRRNGELMAVEVKDGNDGLSPQQYETISDLRRAGIPTFVWAPDTGYTEVGPPVGESIFSAAATIAQMREAMAARLRPRVVPDPEDDVQWAFVENDLNSLNALRYECLRSHQNHQLYKKIGTTGAHCSDVAVAVRRQSPEEILAALGLPNLGLLRRNIDRGRAIMFRYQHERLHRGIGIGRRYTSCPRAV